MSTMKEHCRLPRGLEVARAGVRAPHSMEHPTCIVIRVGPSSEQRSHTTCHVICAIEIVLYRS